MNENKHKYHDIKMSKHGIPMVIVQGMDHRSQNVRGSRALVGAHSVQSLPFVNEGSEGQRCWGLVQGSVQLVTKWQCQEYS